MNSRIKAKLIEAIVGAPFALVIGFLVIKQKSFVDKALSRYL